MAAATPTDSGEPVETPETPALGMPCTMQAFCACIRAAATPEQRQACIDDWTRSCPEQPVPDCDIKGDESPC